MKYSGPFWIFLSNKTNMPIEVKKCTFCPTIHPQRDGRWEEVWLRGTVDSPPTRMDELNSLIKGHMEAIRPLLNEWAEYQNCKDKGIDP